MATQTAIQNRDLSTELAPTRTGTRMFKRKGRSLVLYAAAVFFAIWTLIPIYWMLNLSIIFKEELVNVPANLIPENPTFTNYIRIFDLPAYGPAGEKLDPVGQSFLVRRGWINSIAIAIPVTILTMVVSLPIAYALGRLKFKGQDALLILLLSTRSYPPVATLVPFSAIFFKIGLQSTIWGLMLIYLTLTIPFVAWVMSGFFAALPRNVENAARTDGLTRFGAFYKILVPMAMPGIAACAAISFIICWSEFAFSYILAAGSTAQTFPPTLAGLLYQYAQINEVAAVCIVGLIPPALLAFLFQRQIRNLNIVNPL